MSASGWTAFRALHDKLKITSADTLLVTGGSGGTGSFAVRCPRPKARRMMPLRRDVVEQVQLAKAAGVRTIIATCR